MKLRVSQDQRTLERVDGRSFIWLGDTAWELAHRLNRAEVEHYLERRANQGFTVVQSVALAELDGLRAPNAYGRVPLHQNESGTFDPTLPDVEGEYSYWAHLDFMLEQARQRGLYVALLPTWGDKFNLDAWGKGPVVFTPENAKLYGAWLGARYRDFENVVWVMGGDRTLLTRQHLNIVHQMALGVRESVGNGALISFHPCGNSSSSKHVHTELWLDFNMIQSGHGARDLHNDTLVDLDYALEPVKPVLDAEPCYEDHPIGFDAANGYFDAADVRLAAYRAVLAGAFGHSYGHHSIWQFWTESDLWSDRPNYVIMDWTRALERPGANQMRHLRTLLESRPARGRIPDQTLLLENFVGANHMRAARGPGYAWVYTPCGLPFRLRGDRFGTSPLSWSWFNPRSGEFGIEHPLEHAETLRFLPPSSGRGEDWILVLEGAEVQGV
jgi:hypothetical protein